MTAEEMFSKLGFTKKKCDDDCLNVLEVWKIELPYTCFDTQNEIVFWKNKCYFTSNGADYEDETGLIITIEIHQAITQRMKELGWLEE